MKRTPGLQTGDILILGGALGRVKEPQAERAPLPVTDGG